MPCTHSTFHTKNSTAQMRITKAPSKYRLGRRSLYPWRRGLSRWDATASTPHRIMPPISTQPGRLSPSSTSAIFTLKITHNAMSSHAAISFLILIQPSMSCCFLLSSKKLPPFRRYPPDSIRCLFHLTPLSLSCPAFSGVWKLSCKKTRRLVVFSAIIVQTAEKCL